MIRQRLEPPIEPAGKFEDAVLPHEVAELTTVPEAQLGNLDEVAGAPRRLVVQTGAFEGAAAWFIDALDVIGDRGGDVCLSGSPSTMPYGQFSLFSFKPKLDEVAAVGKVPTNGGQVIAHI